MTSISNRVSTSISFPASRFSSSIVQLRLRLARISKPIDNVTGHRDASYGMVRSKSARNTATAIWAMSSMMARAKWAACATINSASLRFVPKDQMEAEGYGAYLDQVEEKYELNVPYWRRLLLGMQDLIRKLPGVESTRLATPAVT